MDERGWDERYASAEMVWSAEPNRWVADEVAGLAPGRALDLAAGEGRNAIWLAGNGWRTVAVDFSAVGIDKGRRLAAERGVEVDWRIDDLTRTKLAQAAFDLVLHCYLHLAEPDRSTVLERAVAAVAPGGTFLLVGHDRSNIERGHGGPQDPELLTTPEEVVEQLGDLEVVRAEVVEREVEPGAVALDTLVRARRKG